MTRRISIASIAAAAAVTVAGCGDNADGIDAGAGPDPDAGADHDAGVDAGIAPPPCDWDYHQGHGDLYTTYDGAGGLSLALRSALEPPAGEQLYDPARVCIHVPRSTYDEVEAFGGRPPGAGWDPVGVVAGQPFWYLPEIAIDGVPWFGIASDPGRLGGVPVGVLGESLTLAIAVAGPPGATFSAWGTVDDPEAPPFAFSTATGLDTATVIASSHAHLSWGFTHPGDYRVEATVAGTVVTTGEAVTSAPAIYRFVVHE
jgi:surface-anchored protein